MSERRWLFIRNGQKEGPVPESQLQHLIATGYLPSNTYVWSDHLSDWVVANTVDCLQAGAPKAAQNTQRGPLAQAAAPQGAVGQQQAPPQAMPGQQSGNQLPQWNEPTPVQKPAELVANGLPPWNEPAPVLPVTEPTFAHAQVLPPTQPGMQPDAAQSPRFDAWGGTAVAAPTATESARQIAPEQDAVHSPQSAAQSAWPTADSWSEPAWDEPAVTRSKVVESAKQTAREQGAVYAQQKQNQQSGYAGDNAAAARRPKPPQQADAAPSQNARSNDGAQEAVSTANVFKSKVAASVNAAMSDEETRQFVTGYWEQVKAIFLTPNVFFETMPTTGGYAEPVKFFAVALAVYCIGSAITTFGLMVPGIMLVLMPVCMALGSVVINFMAKAMGGKGTLEGTVRVYCYTYATLLVQWIPIVGIVGGLYAMALWFIGFRKIHQISVGQTIAVIILAAVLWSVVIGTVGLVAGIGMLSRL